MRLKMKIQKYTFYHLKEDNSVKKINYPKSHDLYCDVIRFLHYVTMIGKHKHL